MKTNNAFIKSLTFAVLFTLLFSLSFTNKVSAQGNVPVFYSGVTVTQLQEYFNVKIEREALPKEMRDFSLISVWGVPNVSSDMIGLIVDETIQKGYGLQQYNELNGYNEFNDAPYNVVLLFGEKNNGSLTALGYYVIYSQPTSHVTIETLVNLLKDFYDNGCIKNKGIFNSLMTKLEHEDLGAFTNELNAQLGKGVDMETGKILIDKAAQIKINN
jgi:hypothetical protein